MLSNKVDPLNRILCFETFRNSFVLIFSPLPLPLYTPVEVCTAARRLSNRGGGAKIIPPGLDRQEVRMGKSRIVAWLSTSKSNHPANIDTIRMRDKCHCAVCKCHSNHTIFTFREEVRSIRTFHLHNRERELTCLCKG